MPVGEGPRYRYTGSGTADHRVAADGIHWIRRPCSRLSRRSNHTVRLVGPGSGADTRSDPIPHVRNYLFSYTK